MKKFCENVLCGEQITYNDLVTFIIEYLELNNKEFENKDIARIIQVIQMGALDLKYAIKMYCKQKEYTIYTVSKDNQIIKVWIE